VRTSVRCDYLKEAPGTELYQSSFPYHQCSLHLILSRQVAFPLPSHRLCLCLWRSNLVRLHGLAEDPYSWNKISPVDAARGMSLSIQPHTVSLPPDPKQTPAAELGSKVPKH